jgi:hypothetical protein
MWTWHWWLFIVLIIPSYGFVLFFRRRMNSYNALAYGMRADVDWQMLFHPVRFRLGSLAAGAIWAAIFTAVAGFWF